ncbi:Fe(3+) dicitrate transport protein [Wenyingzhuangia heitensis]|uniref:Fe(3+) dicitrate transport protein n=1 Tax=Wenyingzhuangia heitensis TaxID=1487859 RepID=A0ABX0UF90_9FLAO|nr:TonB-dependent receptor [Wenyingzhuangia heitensis]NIJ45677.1 Fe(3+) dicitrate transport protein [Wenyingzhuangia heitensis]
MKLKDFSILVLLLLFVQLSYAYQITFKLINAETQKPVEGVQVVEGTKNYLGNTNQKGILKANFNKNKVRLMFFYYGYATVEQDYNFAKSQQITIYLAPLKEELSAVVLNAKKRINYGLTTLKPVEGTHIYAGKKTEVVNLDLVSGNKASNNPRQIFAKVAGLNIYDSNDGGLQLNIGGRGLDPNRTANFNTRQNDYDISADVLGYPESYYTPPTEALEQIQVIRGAASLQYGTQFGGLINFITKKPVDKPIELITRNTVASFGTLSNFTSVSGTVNKLNYYAYYNGKQGDGFRPNSDYESTNFFAHVGYQFTENTKASLEVSSFNYTAHQPGGLSDVQFIEDPTQSYLERNWFDVDWKLYNFKLEQQITDASKLTVSLFALDASRKAVGFRGDPTAEKPAIFNTNGDEQNTDGTYVFNRDLIVGNFKNYGVETRFLSSYELGDTTNYYLLGGKIYKANNNQRQGAGSKGTDADFSFADADQYPNQNNFDFPNFNASLFGEHIFNINKHLSITPGFRFEHISTKSDGTYYVFNKNNSNLSEHIEDNNSFVRNFVLLGLGISYKPNSFFETYGNFSQNYRSVTFSDIRTVNPSFIIDENITDETGFTADIGVRGKVDKAFSYDLSAFTLVYGNRIGQVLNKRAQWVRKNIGTAFIYGLESLLQWNIKETYFKNNEHLKLDVYTNIAVTKSVYLDSEENNVAGNEVEFIPLMNVKTGASFGWDNLLGNIQYTYLSEQFTDVTNSPYDANNEQNVIGAIPSYDILDVSLSYKFSKHFLLETGINNILDNSYFTRRATGYPGPGIIPAEPRYFYGTLEIKF